MCDCCKAENRNFKKACGIDAKVITARLYKIYVGRTTSIQLCKLCDIELFHIGESRFLSKNIQFAQNLVVSKSSSVFD